jgi:Cd2+/Zn2+-exporting ATPase/Cu+-exporting ATPase
MSRHEVLELLIEGMDCAHCALDVERCIAAVPGVKSVEVLYSAGRAVIHLDLDRADMAAIHRAIEGRGCSIPLVTPSRRGLETQATDTVPKLLPAGFGRSVLVLFAAVFAAVLFVVVIGEWLGLFEAYTERVPWPVGVAIVLLFGYPVIRNVIRAAVRRRITSHTLMTAGLLAALAVGQWPTAVLIVFFMRLADYVERFTTERARRALRDLTAMAPQRARVERDGDEREIPASGVQVGDVVIVRPGEKIPVDGVVVSGQATVDQSAITGESMPVEVGEGAKVFAASIASLGSLRIRTTHVGADTTFGRVIRLVEEAETHRAEVQRVADRFSTYYLPVVASVAALTFLVSRNALATAAVLVVACSCSFALATPIALLASIGAAARRGLIVKGGKYIESLARADVLLVDKTGTLTLGRPAITDVIPLKAVSERHVLELAASAEKYSEHPLARAVVAAAQERGVALQEPRDFVAIPGLGVRARVYGTSIAVGSRRMAAGSDSLLLAEELEAQGKTLLFVAQEDELIGILAAADTVRPEVPGALATVRTLGLHHIELLTGDNERVAAALATQLGVTYRANLLPEDKIAIVRQYQRQGKTVVMVGDGVNDAPALAQADVGIAMGAAGTDVAIEAAHIAVMREDWTLVPVVIRIAQRTMRVVKLNIGFTAVYNLAGLTLAALGLLPPVLAAAAQSLPDLVILGNSARLLKPTGA